MVTLLRPARVAAALPEGELDPHQSAAVAHRGRLLRVVGAPGTGKTTVAVACVVDRVRSGEARADECLLLAPTRLAAADLRDRVTAAVGGTSTEPLARTMSSLAFGLLRESAALAGEPPPTLLSGPEQDLVLRDLLAGHADGSVPGPGWPEALAPALATRGFRHELRDLFMRAAEHDVGPEDLSRMGRETGRPHWVAAARVLAEYEQVMLLRSPSVHDPASIVGAATDLLLTDGSARDRIRDRIRLVVVDDAQEVTSAGVRLLTALAALGADVVLLGDPDAAVQTFRGGEPRWFAAGWESLLPPPAGQGELFSLEGGASATPATVVLSHGHRVPAVISEAVARVTGHIGVLGTAAHRSPSTREAGGVVEAHVLRSTAQEAAFVAGELRAAHLRDGVPWSRMAVLVRGQGRTGTLRRVLAGHGIPVGTTGAEQPVRDEPAVRPLLVLLREVVDLALGRRDGYDPGAVVDVLTSVVGGGDAVGLRRLRRELRRSELAEGGGRTGEELLAVAVRHPAPLHELGAESFPARRVAAMLAAGLAAARVVDGRGGRPQWAPGVTAETILWAMWSASGLSSAWRARALTGGPAGLRADRDLDAVIALFQVAGRYVDRLPGLGPEGFLEHLVGQEVAADTLGDRAPASEVVEILTPVAAAGREWDLVVVSGVQEGVWPDLRLRGSVLGSTALVDHLAGRASDWRAAQRAVRHDETRLFHVALTRARDRVLVTAVRSDDEQPSAFLDLVGCSAAPEASGDGFTEVARPMTLPGVVAELRRELVDADPGVRGAAVTALARLARARVPGADPRGWWALREPTDDRPLRAADAPVTVSPSKIEQFADCGLRWLLTNRGAEGPPVGSAQVGTLVHEIAAALPDEATTDERLAALDRSWHRLGLTPGWVERQQRRLTEQMLVRIGDHLDRANADGWRRVAAEAGMRVALGRAVVQGSMDRVEEHSERGFRVIDLKTGSSKPSSAQVAVHPQLGAYQLAVERGEIADLPGDRHSAGAALLQVGKAWTRTNPLQVQVPVAESDDPSWVERLVEETADGMSAGSFTARPEASRCRTCPVRMCCPAHAEGGRL